MALWLISCVSVTGLAQGVNELLLLGVSLRMFLERDQRLNW